MIRNTDNMRGSGGIRGTGALGGSPGRAPVEFLQPTANADYVKGLYKELLGREPDLDGYHAHMKALEGGKVSREQLRDAFMDSPEFKERLARLNKLEADTNAAATGGASSQAFLGGGDIPLPPGMAAPAAPAAGRLPNGIATDARSWPPGPVPLEGYDYGKLNNPAHMTVKYQFGRVASNYPLDGVKDHAGAQALLEKMLPDLKAAGLNVKGVNRDKILVETELGDEWVDVVRGAGSGNPGWWWGSEGKAVPGTAKTPGAPGGPVVNGPAAGEPGTPLATVPLTPAMKAAADAILAANPGIKGNMAALTKAVAAYVKDHNMEAMPVGDDRAQMMKVMTQVIGVIRSMGIDAFRVVNHPSHPEGNPARYGSDAVVINGRIFDVYRSFGEANEPVEQDVGPWNQERAKGLRE